MWTDDLSDLWRKENLFRVNGMGDVDEDATTLVGFVPFVVDMKTTARDKNV